MLVSDEIWRVHGSEIVFSHSFAARCRCQEGSVRATRDTAFHPRAVQGSAHVYDPEGQEPGHESAHPCTMGQITMDIRVRKGIQVVVFVFVVWLVLNILDYLF
jgi:hypothetical protein